MSALYESIKKLCDERGIKPGKMCAEIGISRGLISDLKSERTKSITSETAQKIADYFGVSVDRVLGTEQKEKPAHDVDELSELKKHAHNLIDGISEDELEKLMPAIERLFGK